MKYVDEEILRSTISLLSCEPAGIKTRRSSPLLRDFQRSSEGSSTRIPGSFDFLNYNLNSLSPIGVREQASSVLKYSSSSACSVPELEAKSALQMGVCGLSVGSPSSLRDLLVIERAVEEE
ncbi:MAG: hypothetical protein M1839_003163 [Geoglossum umbratile]|nr:MAG: hypothetical protein M1839_003163 [Geoglossum umbratile]